MSKYFKNFKYVHGFGTEGEDNAVYKDENTKASVENTAIQCCAFIKLLTFQIKSETTTTHARTYAHSRSSSVARDRKVYRLWILLIQTIYRAARDLLQFLSNKTRKLPTLLYSSLFYNELICMHKCIHIFKNFKHSAGGLRNSTRPFVVFYALVLSLQTRNERLHFLFCIHC